MDKEGSMILGTLIATGIAGAIFSAISQSLTIGFLAGLAFLVICIVTWIILAVRRVPPRLAELSMRERFWMPFIAIFLTPLWLAVIALIYDWRLDQPILRYGVIAGCFLLCVPSLMLHRWLSGVSVRTAEKPMQSPEPTVEPVAPTERRGR
ncbi:MAG: hypothetical protein H7A44_05970 [Opitutaceae bacterium]|nr:hypothetical protein [Cephaloticoccus sp.]MCP5529970.1 hypothetical protein [Opitutaceae bacterium]